MRWTRLITRTAASGAALGTGIGMLLFNGSSAGTVYLVLAALLLPLPLWRPFARMAGLPIRVVAVDAQAATTHHGPMRTPFTEFMSYTKPCTEPCPACGTFALRLYTEPGQTEEKAICTNRYCTMSPFHRGEEWPPRRDTADPTP